MSGHWVTKLKSVSLCYNEKVALGGLPISKWANKFAGKRQRIHAGKCLNINNIGCMEAEELN
jgi:hypothetical protein